MTTDLPTQPAAPEQVALTERAFAKWLDERRMQDVSQVFHDIVYHYRSALAAPHPSPSAAGRLAPVGWQERQATRDGWSAWYHVDKVPSVAFMAARDNYQWRRVFASTSPAIAHVIALGSPDDLITVANVTLEDSGPTLTLHFDQLGDMGSILGEKEATYTVRIAPMRRGDFDDLGEFDGF